jgi:hypothetical protein
MSVLLNYLDKLKKAEPIAPRAPGRGSLDKMRAEREQAVAATFARRRPKAAPVEPVESTEPGDEAT